MKYRSYQNNVPQASTQAPSKNIRFYVNFKFQINVAHFQFLMKELSEHFAEQAVHKLVPVVLIVVHPCYSASQNSGFNTV